MDFYPHSGDVINAKILTTSCPEAFVSLSFSAELHDDTVKLLSIHLSRGEVIRIIGQLMECDEHWPTEPPAEEPTEEDLHPHRTASEVETKKKFVDRRYIGPLKDSDGPAEEPTAEDERGLNHGNYGRTTKL